jgi:hypothetical protein
MTGPEPQLAWHESLDAALLRRLLLPLDKPGLLSPVVVQRIFAWVEHFSGRLPLLQELAKRRGGGHLRMNEVPIVHARWVQAAAPEAEPARVVQERVVVQAAAVPVAASRSLQGPSAVTPGPLPAPFPVVAAGSLSPVKASRPARGSPPGPPQGFQMASGTPPVRPQGLQMASGTPPVRPQGVQMASGTPSVSLEASRPVSLEASRPAPWAPLSLPQAPPPPGRSLFSPPDASPPEALPPGASPSRPLFPHELAARPVVTPVAAPPLTDVVAPLRPRVFPRASRAPAPPVELPHVRAAAVSDAAASPPAAEGSAGGAVTRTAPAAVHLAESAVAAQASAQAQAAPAAAPEVDVDALVEKVQRKLLRRMASERERRGGIG